MNQIILHSRAISHLGRVHLPSAVLVGKQHLDGLQTTGKRNMFTDEVLGIDKFLHNRNRVQSAFKGYKEKFVERLDEHLNLEGNSILSDDLKNLIFLCEDNDKELELLKKTIDKFEEQNKSLRFGNFQFGPVVMRLGHHLNKPDFALQLMDKKLINFYSQISSVTIAMNLLFKNGKYEEVVNLFNFVNKNYNFETSFLPDMVTLYVAASYKINTQEAFENVFKVIRSAKLAAKVVKLRALCLFFKMAIEHGHPNIALEVIQQLNFKIYPISVQSLRLLAFSEINRFRDVFEIMRFYLRRDKARTNSKIVHQDVLEKIRANVQKTNNEEKVKEFEQLAKNLEESNLIVKDITLEAALMKPIQARIPRTRAGANKKASESDSDAEVAAAQ